MVTIGCRRRKSETKRNAKKQPRRSRKVRHITPTSRPRREGPVISGQREGCLAAANMPLARRSIRSRRFAVASFGGRGAEPPISPGGSELYGRADQIASTGVITHPEIIQLFSICSPQHPGDDAPKKPAPESGPSLLVRSGKASEDADIFCQAGEGVQVRERDDVVSAKVEHHSAVRDRRVG